MKSLLAWLLGLPKCEVRVIDIHNKVVWRKTCHLTLERNCDGGLVVSTVKPVLTFGPARGLTPVEGVEIDGMGPGDKLFYQPDRVNLWEGDFYAVRVLNTLTQ